MLLKDLYVRAINAALGIKEPFVMSKKTATIAGAGTFAVIGGTVMYFIPVASIVTGALTGALLGAGIGFAAAVIYNNVISPVSLWLSNIANKAAHAVARNKTIAGIGRAISLIARENWNTWGASIFVDFPKAIVHAVPVLLKWSDAKIANGASLLRDAALFIVHSRVAGWLGKPFTGIASIARVIFNWFDGRWIRDSVSAVRGLTSSVIHSRVAGWLGKPFTGMASIARIIYNWFDGSWIRNSVSAIGNSASLIIHSKAVASMGKPFASAAHYTRAFFNLMGTLISRGTSFVRSATSSVIHSKVVAGTGHAIGRMFILPFKVLNPIKATTMGTAGGVAFGMVLGSMPFIGTGFVLGSLVGAGAGLFVGVMVDVELAKERAQTQPVSLKAKASPSALRKLVAPLIVAAALAGAAGKAQAGTENFSVPRPSAAAQDNARIYPLDRTYMLDQKFIEQTAGGIISTGSEHGISVEPKEAKAAAEKISMLNNGIVPAGVSVTVDNDGKEFVIEAGKVSQDLTKAINNNMPGLNLRNAYGELAVTIMPDGNIELSGQTSITIRDGKIVDSTCPQDIHPGSGAVYMHSHPDTAKATGKLSADEVFELKTGADRGNLNDGNFADTEKIYVIQSDGSVKPIKRDTVIGQGESAQQRWTNTHIFEMANGLLVRETIRTTRYEANAGNIPEAVKGLGIAPMVQPAAPSMNLPLASALSPGGNRLDEARKKALISIMDNMDSQGKNWANYVCEGIAELRRAGTITGTAVLAFEIGDVYDKNGKETDETFKQLVDSAHGKGDMIKIVLIARDFKQRDEMVEKGVTLPIAIVDGSQRPSIAVKSVLKDSNITNVAIFIKDTGHGELSWIYKDAQAAKTNSKPENIPAYAVLNHLTPDGATLEKGKANMRNWLASILFQSAFVAFGYKENDPQLAGFSDIFNFCKIFRTVSEAVQRIMDAIKKTAISL